MISLGLNNIDGVNLSKENTMGSYARLKEKTFAKDTTAGHYEICGVVMKNPYPTFKDGFPQDLLSKIKETTGVEFIGNKVASGTEIIKELGKKHIDSQKPIIYTSADSVLQIAAHTDIYSLKKLYKLCEKVREICSTPPYNIGRIIARPFATNDNGEFYRLDSRKDYALSCPEKSLLDKLQSNNLDTVCIGKIEDIFNYRGITESYHSRSNSEGIKEIIKQTKRRDISGLIFANLNDTDMLFGHRNDCKGYANCLKEIDEALPEIINSLASDDILLITADHGCDPTTPSTDHSREYVPLLIYGKNLKNNVNFGTIEGFDIINNSILNEFNIEKHESIFEQLK
jgi:phosphopentomutase